MSLVLKFKSWLRNWLAMDSPPQIGEGPLTISDGAAQLVERARAGDQNALAMICEVRDRSKSGNPRAKKAFIELETYIKKHPIEMKVSFGEDELEVDQLCENVVCSFEGEDYAEIVKLKVPEIAFRSINKAVVTLANGPSLLSRDGSTLLEDVKLSLEGDDQKAFVRGYKQGVKELNGVPSRLRLPFLLGHILGTARRIQAVRIPGMSVSVLSPTLGMELGE